MRTATVLQIGLCLVVACLGASTQADAVSLSSGPGHFDLEAGVDQHELKVKEGLKNWP
jgi:hypothetical protein